MVKQPKVEKGVSKLPDSQLEEYKLATREGRQPRCISCGEPLDKVVEVQTTVIVWTWDGERKQYIKDDSGGDSDCPECDRCGAKDWEFTEDNKFISY